MSSHRVKHTSSIYGKHHITISARCSCSVVFRSIVIVGNDSQIRRTDAVPRGVFVDAKQIQISCEKRLGNTDTLCLIPRHRAQTKLLLAVDLASSPSTGAGRTTHDFSVTLFQSTADKRVPTYVMS
jgi:hypothetical protein